ncbi:NAD(P)/FAD-dependent oxidoreductase [Streptosporangium sp. NBC_01756]|uniref:NAD(P)/FAD-dependent oxidoreductase n=1 Tax=Streptosporangium sp. NBC_01756 TaxID=2975950 RepID=UPI002DDAEE8B|nr:FAD-dependent monooxygenase [Streptosporangium sp. NBC_01756]WSC88665.1 FAD-dependent oxidoreductase [Streptosporangium sp. NBC_01756]
MTRAVVLGGGLAGALAASVLARHVDEVVILEGDRYPDAPRSRKGVPQAQHNHMLMGGGAAAIDELLPGTTALLYAAGAYHRKIGQLVTLSAQGWFRRVDSDAYVINCTRPLVDHVVRTQAFRDEKIKVIESAKVVGLVGDAGRVRGVRFEQGQESPAEITADFVVDATGSRSKAPQWLAELGLPAVEEEFVDAGLSYAGRFYEVPEGTREDFPGVLMQTEPGTGHPGRGAALMLQEGRRWIVTLMGTRGDTPPSDEEGFMAYAKRLRHPIIADLLSLARPLTPIRASRAMADRRKYFDRLPVPEGFVAIGDAAMVLSPNYATGMSMAAFGAQALHEGLEGGGLRPGLSRSVQTAVIKAGEWPWQMAIGNDRWFPQVETNLTGKRVLGLDVAGMTDSMMRRFNVRFARTAAENPMVASATYAVTALSAQPSEMMAPPIMWAVMRGPRRPPLSAEEALAQYPELGDLLNPVPAFPPVPGQRVDAPDRT